MPLLVLRGVYKFDTRKGQGTKGGGGGEGTVNKGTMGEVIVTLRT